MRRILLLAASALLLAVAAVSGASADSGSRSYDFLAGSGFLCGLDPSACPDVSRAANGDTIEIRGGGSFTIHPKSASGGGTFTHKNSTGAVLGTGTWTVETLKSFHSYGDATPQGLPSNFEGGKVVFRVHLTPAGGGPGFDATLQVDCLLGSKIPGGAAEGVRLAIQRGPNFNREVSGFTIFDRTA